MATKGYFLTFGLIISIVFAAIIFAKGQNQKPYIINENVNLKGSVSIEEKYGPPNYGESPEIDKVENIYVLTLSEPISVFKDKEPTSIIAKGQYKVQLLIVGIKSKAFIDAEGCKRVEGQIFEATSGHHHFPILMDVKNIKNC